MSPPTLPALRDGTGLVLYFTTCPGASCSQVYGMADARILTFRVAVDAAGTSPIKRYAMTENKKAPDSQGKPDFSNVQSGSSSTAPSPQTAATTYVVKQGDSLSKIAKRHYGDANAWHKIYEANRDQIKDPDLIQPGWSLRLP